MVYHIKVLTTFMYVYNYSVYIDSKKCFNTTVCLSLQVYLMIRGFAPHHFSNFSSEPSGIFVKSVTKDSAVDQDGRIHVGDQIIAVSTLIMLFVARTFSVSNGMR